MKKPRTRGRLHRARLAAKSRIRTLEDDLALSLAEEIRIEIDRELIEDLGKMLKLDSIYK